MIRLTLFVIGVFAPIGLLAIPFNGHDTKNPQTATESSQSHGVRPLREPHDFEEFLGKCFRKPVLEYTIKSLTKYGDHRGSELQALNVKFSKNNGSTEIETLPLVFKVALSGSISTRKSKQFWKEAHFYSDIIPALEQFEKTANIPESERIDGFARCLCSRLSLNPEAVNADTNVLILLENLKSINFASPSIPDRFNRDEVLAALKKLAKMHALFIAMRRLQPDLFFSKVNQYLVNSYDAPVVRHLAKGTEAFIDKIPSNYSNISPELRNAIEDAKILFKNFHINTTRVPDTPYTTFYHSDLHSKNIMTKKSSSPNTPIQMKIVDFQSFYYGSFALDLTQFVFFNSRIDDLRADFKTFINYYISEFVKMLRLSNCPLDDYTNEKMWSEIKDKAKISLPKIYSYLEGEKVIVLDNSTRLIDSGTVTQDFYYDHATPEIFLQRWKCVTDLYIENGFI